MIIKRLANWDSVPLSQQKIHGKPPLRSGWAPDGLKDIVSVRPNLLKMHKRKTLPRVYEDASEDNRILRIFEKLMECEL